MIVADSSDEESMPWRLSPDYPGSMASYKRFFEPPSPRPPNAVSVKAEMKMEFKNSFLRPMTRHIDRCIRHHRLKERMSKLVRGADVNIFPWVAAEKNGCAIGDQVDVALAEYLGTRGVVKRVLRGQRYCVEIKKKRVVLPGCLLRVAEGCGNRREGVGFTTVPVEPRRCYPPASFNCNDLVEVEARTWSGINKEGGVGIVCKVHPPVNPQSSTVGTDDEDDDRYPTYDVRYVVSGGREFRVAAKYLSLKSFVDRSEQRRETLGRCNLPGCGSFVLDCKHEQLGQRAVIIADKLHETNKKTGQPKKSVAVCPPRVEPKIRKRQKAIPVRRNKSCETSKPAKRLKRRRTKGESCTLKYAGSHKRKVVGSFTDLSHWAFVDEEDTMFDESSDSTKINRQRIRELLCDSSSDDEDSFPTRSSLVRDSNLSPTVSSRDTGASCSVDENNASPISAGQRRSKNIGIESSYISSKKSSGGQRVEISTCSSLHNQELDKRGESIIMFENAVPGNVTQVDDSISRRASSHRGVTAPHATVRCTSGISSRPVGVGSLKEVRPKQSAHSQCVQINVSDETFSSATDVFTESGIMLSTAVAVSDGLKRVRSHSENEARGLCEVEASCSTEPSINQDSEDAFITAEGQNLPPDLKEYLYAQLLGLSVRDMLRLYKARLKEMEGFINQCHNYKRQFVELGINLSASGAFAANFLEELDSLNQTFKKFKMNVEWRVVDTCNEIARLLEESNNLSQKQQLKLENFESALDLSRTEFEEAKHKVNAIVRDLDTVISRQNEARDIVNDSDSDSLLESEYYTSSDESVGDAVVEVQNHDHTQSKREHLRNENAPHLNCPTRQDTIDDDFISSEDDVFGSREGMRRKRSKRIKELHVSDRNLGPSTVVSVDVTKKPNKYYREKSLLHIENAINLMARNEAISLRGDMLYSTDETFLSLDGASNEQILLDLSDRERRKLSAQSAVTTILASEEDKSNNSISCQCCDETPLFSVLREIFLSTLEICMRSTGDRTWRKSLTLRLLQLDVIWQQYALWDVVLCEEFLRLCTCLEIECSVNLYGRNSRFVETLSNWAEESKGAGCGLFAFLRRKSIWIKLGAHVVDIRCARQMNVDAQQVELDVDVLQSLLRSAEHGLWAQLSLGLILYAQYMPEVLNLLLCKSPSPLTGTHLRENVLSEALDIVFSWNTLQATCFADPEQLAVSASVPHDIAASSELGNYKWDTFNAYVLQATMWIRYNSDESLVSYVDVFLRTGHCAVISTCGTPCRESREVVTFLDRSIWIATVLHSFVMLSNTLLFQTSGHVTVDANWLILKELSSSACDPASISLWMQRVCTILPFWKTPSNGFDLFRDLLTRLLADTPWSEHCHAGDTVSKYSSPERLKALVTLATELSSKLYRSINTAVLSPFSACAESNILALFADMLDVSPPDYMSSCILPVDAYGKHMVTAVTNIFTYGMRHIPSGSTDYKRLQSRVCKMTSLWKDAPTFSVAVALVHIFRSIVDKYGCALYTHSFHQTLISALSYEKFTSAEKLYLSWFAIYALFAPAQVCDADEVSTCIVKEGFDYLYTTCKQYISDICVTQMMETPISNELKGVGVMVLLSCYDVLNGVSKRGFGEGDAERMRTVFVVLNQCMSYGNITESSSWTWDIAVDLLSFFYTSLLQYLEKSERVCKEAVSSIFQSCIATPDKKMTNHRYNRPEWTKCMRVVRVLSSMCCTAVYAVMDSKVLGDVAFRLLDVLKLPIEVSDYPYDMWLKCGFWSHMFSQFCSDSTPLARQNRLRMLSLFTPNHSVFSVWVGCMTTIASAGEDHAFETTIGFDTLHEYLLSPTFLERPSGQRCLFSEACVRLTSMMSFNPRDRSGYHQDMYLRCIHAFVLSCAACASARPMTEKKALKELCKPVVNTIDRCITYIKLTASTKSSKQHAKLQLFVQTLIGSVSCGALASLMDIDDFITLFHSNISIPADNFSVFLNRHCKRMTLGCSEPSLSDVLVLTNLRYYICGTSFFPYHRIPWKLLLRWMVMARLHAHRSVREFVTRVWSIALCHRAHIPDKVLYDTIPFLWSTTIKVSVSEFVLPSAYETARQEISNNKSTFVADLSNPSSSYANPYYQQKQLQLLAVSTAFSKLDAQIAAKLGAFRKYVMTTDGVWTEESLEMMSGGSSQTAITSAYLDLITDYSYLVMSFVPIESGRGEALSIIAIHLELSAVVHAIRVLLLGLGESVSGVLGGHTDDDEGETLACAEAMCKCIKAVCFLAAVTANSVRICGPWTDILRACCSSILSDCSDLRSVHRIGVAYLTSIPQSSQGSLIKLECQKHLDVLDERLLADLASCRRVLSLSSRESILSGIQMLP